MPKAHLSKELREKYGYRSFGVRKGDTVKVMRGKFRGKTGVVERVVGDKLYIDGIKVEKQEGKMVNVPIHVSNVEIIKMVLEDKKRKAKLEAKKK
jgi:large subunit ribosomal protein L24